MPTDQKTPARKKFTTRNFYVAGIVLAAALAILRMYGMSVLDLAHLARAKLAEAARDARELTTREYADTYARRLREEAAAIPLEVPGMDGKETAEISRAIQAERIRILEERADRLKQVGEVMLKGDLESMKKQVEENAHNAAGNH